MGAVVLLVAAWVVCSVVACMVVAAVVARADRRPAAVTSMAPAAHVVPLMPALVEDPALPEAARGV